jgi:hypothetical protein
VVVGEKGKKYSAISPSESLSSLVEQEEIRRDQMTQRKIKVISEWTASQRSVSSIEVEPERLQVLRDVRIALERGINIAIGSKRICRVMLRGATIKEYISSEILRVIESYELMERLMQKSSVQFHLLVISPTPDISGLREVLSKVKLPPNVEVRWATSPMLEILPDAVIADGDEMLIHTLPIWEAENAGTEQRSSKAVVTNVPVMIGSFIVLFDQHWKNASNFHP